MMRKILWVWMLVTLLLALVNDWYAPCYGCLEEERNGLLEIKASFDPNSSWSFKFWVDNKDEDIGNCCDWPLVVCDDSRSQVIKLYLEDTYNHRSLGNHGILNTSLFLPFTELQNLDLRNNGLVGCSDNQGFQVLSPKLRKFEVLQLGGNQFNDSILSSLAGLSSLKSLNLSDNKLTGSTGFYDIIGLRKLEALHLDGSNITGSILLQSLEALPSLKILSLKGSHLSRTSISQGNYFNSTTLEELFLDYCSLPVNILQSIGALSALKALSVIQSELNGTLPAKGWCELKNLEQLSLYGNNLEGSLPGCLGNLSSLQLLDVSENQFTGNIGSGPLTKLISLEFLSLSANLFEVPLSFKSFMNHSNLKFFICDNNTLIEDGPAFENFIPKFQLLFFSMSYSTSKALNLEIPNFLYNQYDLRILDLPHNNFHGMFPSWLLKNNTGLERLNLRHNSFFGPLQLQNHPNLNMTTMDISDNNIHGQISRNMCSIFPNLLILTMAKNGLTGGIPSCFGNMSTLIFLDLSDNGLSMVNLEQLRTLVYLKLSNNNLSGQVSPSVFNSTLLGYLYLDGNNFKGPILMDCRAGALSWVNLFAFDISNNQLSGMLNPRCMAENPQPRAIDFSKNHFKGSIPREFCEFHYLQYLDLSENNFSGSIPYCFNPPNITHVHLAKNQLSGPLPYSFYGSSTLVTLDLTYNNFMGSIPNWISSLSSLSVLLLKANHFDGEFPAQLCLLEHLSILDVSQNNLHGPLPSCLGNFTFKESLEKPFHDESRISGYKSISEMYSETMGPLLVDSLNNLESLYPIVNVEEEVEFTTKRMSYGYKGTILNFMSGIDLSCNNFSGEIPPELGNLSELHALNLSHNNLTGSIPATFSNMKQMESLDLSYNNLNGGIPIQLAQMTSLEVFSVAHNNLSGKTPERKNQFGTFDESSYEGNPLLCGPPLKKKCSEEESPNKPMPTDEQEDDGFIDMEVFYVSFGVCYTIVVLAIVVVLYINPYWRRRWFHFIEEFIDTCYCFVVINFRKLSNFRRS